MQILKELKDKVQFERPFSLYPVVPYAEGYVRGVNEKGMMGLMKDVFSRLSVSGMAKAVLEGSMSALTFDAPRIIRAYLDMELAGYLGIVPEKANLKTIMLHEVVTDLALSFDAFEIFSHFMEHIRDKYHAKPGFVTRNFVRFIDAFMRHEVPLEDVVIMAPFNKLGFQMNPSRQACEDRLATLRSVEVIAISVLAGGYLGLEESVEYLMTLPSLSGVSVGVSSERHAEETFAKLRGWADRQSP
jgi:hypothetical protein